MRTSLCFRLSAMALLFIPMSGSAESTAEALAKIQRSKDPKVIFESVFKSRIYLAKTKMERVSEGKVAYSAPASFRYEIKTPEPELYISDGQAHWKYIAGDRHAQRVSSLDGFGMDFIKLILDPAELAKRYTIAEWSSKEKISALEKSFSTFDVVPTQGAKAAASAAKLFAKLIPKAGGTPEEYLYLIADSKSGQIDEIRLAFPNGNRNIFTFEKWSLSKAGPETFKFEPPPGTAVDKM
jgi:outer membrane lipoprotein-sorting protein